ncbi:RNA polymerase sigma factor [Psychroflexus sp. ALD_RP9]|uniref:RNA polymerase sigma factor n=1 Tax=Psychroflexus sp. ALD_RP9 TaxID=2777186 RepID=UPI001A8C8C50|nr:sigma-70 family RNA polymerase sigma factor [Psychroflexus sp. ALD_RP9]QSS96269.1 sigma-70 family RNA polymerase sigma factor [Psychroflexus sp. ALD_RP9]
MQPDFLIERLQRKDEKAFAKLYDLYSENILGVIMTIVKDQSIAEEVMQDVFVKVWNKAQTYNKSKGRFFTWLLNIARNSAIDRVRSKAFKNTSKNQDIETFAFFLQDDTDLDKASESIGIKKFVNKLKPMCIKLIQLLYFQGFSQKETSETLDIPLGTVKSRNRACLNTLRTSLED